MAEDRRGWKDGGKRKLTVRLSNSHNSGESTIFLFKENVSGERISGDIIITFIFLLSLSHHLLVHVSLMSPSPLASL